MNFLPKLTTALVGLQSLKDKLSEQPAGAAVMLHQSGFTSEESLDARIRELEAKCKLASETELERVELELANLTLLRDTIKNQSELEREQLAANITRAQALIGRRAVLERDYAGLDMVVLVNDKRWAEILACPATGTSYQEAHPAAIQAGMLASIEAERLRNVIPRAIEIIDAELETLRVAIENAQ